MMSALGRFGRVAAIIAIAIPSIGAAPANDPALRAAAAMLGKGYLDAASVPVSPAFAPPPPVAGSGAEARDQEAQTVALSLHATPRWDLARMDADIFTARATSAMSCAAGIEIGPKTTPRTNALLRKTLADFGLSTSAIKRAHQRQRPFMVNGAPQCTPEMDAGLRRDGSYPSGHSAVGYGWGLILARLLPARAEALISRGRSFGDSRRICNVHWRSDVEEGRHAAVVVDARLSANPAFQKDFAAARMELSRRIAFPPPNCEAEAAALALTPVL